MESLWVWRCVVCKITQYECEECYAKFYLPRPHNCSSDEIERQLEVEFDQGFYDETVCTIITDGCTCSLCACRHQFVTLREPRQIREMWDMFLRE
jgi:hypothetical protein